MNVFHICELQWWKIQMDCHYIFYVEEVMAVSKKMWNLYIRVLKSFCAAFGLLKSRSYVRIVWRWSKFDIFCIWYIHYLLWTVHIFNCISCKVYTNITLCGKSLTCTSSSGNSHPDSCILSVVVVLRSDNNFAALFCDSSREM